MCIRDRVQRFLRTGGNDYTLRIVVEVRIVASDFLTQGGQTRMRCITILLFDNHLNRCLTDDVRSWQIGFSKTKVQTARFCPVEDLSDNALFDSLKSLWRNELTQRR